MSKHRRRPEERRIDRHVRLYHWVMDTPAWKSLPAAAMAIYIGLLRQYRGNNNGRIGYSARQAADDANNSRDTAWRMLVEGCLNLLASMSPNEVLVFARHSIKQRER